VVPASTGLAGFSGGNMTLRRTSSRLTAVTLVVFLAAGHSITTHAYQTYGVRVGSRVVTLKWAKLPVHYYVTDRGVNGVSSTQFRDAAARAFSSWQGVTTASVSSQFAGFTSANPFDDDGQTTLGFLSRPDLDRVLGATDFLIDNTTGEIVEADIFFNSAFSWSVAQAGESGRFDLESIILHETGHLFGLGHSSLGETELRAGGGRRVIAAEAVMFPIAMSPGDISGRRPRADDIAGLSELYPAAGFTGEAGSAAGRVTKNGQGIFGAHVVAFNPRTGKLVGNFTVDQQGTFVISSLDPGAYVMRVEPIDDADLDSFFDDADIPKVDLNFRVTYYQQLLIVPAGGGSASVEIKVTPK
jgi:hypothetical protein